ncbi:MAG: hypothetical protein RIC87_02290 [Kiloniellales bacterium]
MEIPLHHRPQERESLREGLEAGTSILMLAPRRVGKTWLMGKIEEDMAEHGWLCISIDLQGKTKEEEFLRELCQRIEESQGLKTRSVNQLKQRFSQAMASVGEGNLADAVGKIDHREFLETLIESLNGGDKPALILIDELALFIQALIKRDADQAKSLLYHLRKQIHAYPNVRWFLTGSVGLDAIARQHGMEGGILGIDPVPLEPFTVAEAESFVEELFGRMPEKRCFTFTDGAFDHLTGEVGWLSPYHIDQVVKLIRPEGNPRKASVEAVEAAFCRILEPSRRLHFSPWVEHIKKNYPAAETQLMAGILDILCETTKGETEATILTKLQKPLGKAPGGRPFKDALIALKSDAYVTRVGESWRFRSGLLRRFWLEYHRS